MGLAIREWVGSLTDVRRDEWKHVVLMLLYGFLALTSYYVVKPARNAVIVDRLGTQNLPLVYIATAAVITAVMILYSRWVDRVGRLRLLLGTLGFLAASLLLFRWLLLGGSLLTSGLFYAWGKLYPLLLVSQFWLVANLLFTTRQAKRLFGLIGLGLILGGAAGSVTAAYAAEAVGTENLLLISVGLLAVCAGLVVALVPDLEDGGQGGARLVERMSGDAFGLLFRSSHLRTLALLLGLTILVETLVDWQFNRAVELFIAGEDEKTAFYGSFFALVNVASVAVQVLFTSWVLRRFGIGVALLVLPVALLISAGGILAVPVLLTAAATKGAEGALRYSLDQSTRELLFLPVPTELKYRVKPLIDLAVYRGGTGVGGLILLLLVNGMGLGIRSVALVVMALVGVWIATTVRMKDEFRASVKRLIGIRDVDVRELVVQNLDADTRREIREAMRCDDRERIRYALSLLRYRGVSGFGPELEELLDHDDPEIRARALVLLAETGYEEAVDRARALLVDPHLFVRVAAINYVSRHGPDDPAREVRRFLAHEGHGVRAAAIALILMGGPTDELMSQGSVEELEREEKLEERLAHARALLEADPASESGRDILESLLEDDDHEVRHAAMRAAGLARVRRFLSVLVERLADPDDRPVAARALSACVPEVQERLMAVLRDPDAPLGIRLTIPALLVEKANQESVKLLVDALEPAPSRVRFEILKALNKIRRSHPDLEFGGYDLDPVVDDEARRAYHWAHRLRCARRKGTCHPLLERTMRQRTEEAAERAFRALGMTYPLEDLQAAFRAMHSTNRVLREQGFELAENILSLRHRNLFDPLLNPDRSLEVVARAAEERFGRRVKGRDETLRELEELDDPWVRLLARIEAGHEVAVGSPLTLETLKDRLAPRVFLGRAAPEREEIPTVMEIIDRAELLSRSKVFEQMRGEELAAVAALAEVEAFGRGQRFGPGSPLDARLYVVDEGRLGAVRDGRILYTAGPGEAFVDASFLDGCGSRAELEALEDSRALSLRRAHLFMVMEERFPVVRGMLNHLGVLIREGGGGGEEPDRRRSKLAGADPCALESPVRGG